MTGTLYEPTKVRQLGRAQAEVETELTLSRTAAELEAEQMKQGRRARLDIDEVNAKELKARTGGRLLAQEMKRQRNIEHIAHDLQVLHFTVERGIDNGLLQMILLP